MGVIVFVGPSAVGKSFAAHILCSQYPHYFMPGALVTTRPQRPNEGSSDRESVSAEAFAALVKNGEFATHGSFHGNRYGYRRHLFEQHEKTVVLNTWPEFLPELLRLPNTIPIAITIRESSLPLLKKRMEQRGDSPKTVTERLDLIRADINTVASQRSNIERKGAFFTISSDSEMHEVILPWILHRFTPPGSNLAVRKV